MAKWGAPDAVEPDAPDPMEAVLREQATAWQALRMGLEEDWAKYTAVGMEMLLMGMAVHLMDQERSKRKSIDVSAGVVLLTLRQQEMAVKVWLCAAFHR